MGRCEYVLAKDSVNNTFEIRQVNEPCGNGNFSCTKSLTVIFPNVTIQLLRGSVVVNDSQIDLPASYGGKFFSTIIPDMWFNAVSCSSYIHFKFSRIYLASSTAYPFICESFYFEKEFNDNVCLEWNLQQNNILRKLFLLFVIFYMILNEKKIQEMKYIFICSAVE